MDYLIDTHNTEFTEALLQWYEINKRKLPWRETKNPYYIWVSEVMLQQTRVDTVIPYYKLWIEKYPSIQAFAEAEEEDVLKTWEGLGYYRRVKNLHVAVKEVKEKYNSVV
ncbi:MAG: A/G-specific adenine glycosylase, partial [Bacilli bacterium]